MEPPADPPLECRAALVLGGARSGKSRYAQALAEAAAPERLYLATASAGDAEMAARIARHRAERGAGWRTLEEPLELAAALRAEAREGRIILVDCVTLWLSNVLLANLDPAEKIADLVDDDRYARRAGGVCFQRGRGGNRARDGARPGVPRLAGSGQPGAGARL